MKRICPVPGIACGPVSCKLLTFEEKLVIEICLEDIIFKTLEAR